MVPSLSSHPVPHVMTLQLYIQTVVLPFFFCIHVFTQLLLLS